MDQIAANPALYCLEHAAKSPDVSLNIERTNISIKTESAL